MKKKKILDYLVYPFVIIGFLTYHFLNKCGCKEQQTQDTTQDDFNNVLDNSTYSGNPLESAIPVDNNTIYNTQPYQQATEEQGDIKTLQSSLTSLSDLNECRTFDCAK